MSGYLEGTQYQFDPGALPSSANARIRVSASDGFNTVSSTVSGLTLGPNQAPRAHIISPRDGASVYSGANVVLHGVGHDAEDGTKMNPTHLSWTSNRDGFLGTGGLKNVTSLSVGLHVLTFSALDSQGATSSSVVTITILPASLPAQGVTCIGHCPTPTPTPTPPYSFPTPCQICPTPTPVPTPECPIQ